MYINILYAIGISLVLSIGACAEVISGESTIGLTYGPRVELHGNIKNLIDSGRLLGMVGNYNINPNVTLSFELDSIKFDGKIGTNTQRISIISLPVIGEYNILSNKVFSPYVSIGMGLNSIKKEYLGNNSISNWTIRFFGGGGLKVNVGMNWILQTEFRYQSYYSNFSSSILMLKISSNLF